MSAISIFVLGFSFLGAIDYLLSDKIGIGSEFKRAFSLFCPMALSMLGMIVIAPAAGVWLAPFFDGFFELFKIDASIIPASLFANDMGGMSLALTVARSADVGNFNAFVVSSMMGCVISFTIPFALGLVKEEQHKELFFGIICGIATVPVGCFASGLICGIDVIVTILSLLPLIFISAIIGVGLVFAPSACMKFFRVFSAVMRLIGIVGLMIAIFTFLTGITLSPYFDSFENAAFVCANACVTLSGMLPAMFIISKLLNKPLEKFGALLGINSVSALAFLGTLVTNASAFGVMEKMDKRGVVMNSAFAVSASFVFGSHLAFTMAFNADYITPMIVGKLVSGIAAVVLVALVYRPKKKIAA